MVSGLKCLYMATVSGSQLLQLKCVLAHITLLTQLYSDCAKDDRPVKHGSLSHCM